ncbi:hypothetical protein DFA_00781 [Cavenderia fasciculata]|uniref:Uncharacterized protein n=1 Tax=Cavenderia fasciculata TaxID=261658 RepID=F4PTT5_CACFS|nr:uncharacterized protein DFA_00781 [Cavenderia fasciculata]EGG20914.1 hypothetical protein DFA_00781 [Cavenderia fasciculata]|eukprot:XP_004358764.1 hypothetical protein DFA_00781 [Cavenderia fasciculata]
MNRFFQKSSFVQRVASSSSKSFAASTFSPSSSSSSSSPSSSSYSTSSPNINSSNSKSYIPTTYTSTSINNNGGLIRISTGNTAAAMELLKALSDGEDDDGRRHG